MQETLATIEHVAPGEQAAGGAVAKLVDLFVDRGVFFDKGVGGRDIGFGLVIVVVGDKVLNGVLGKQLFELAVELGRQGFVVGEHQGRTLRSGRPRCAMVKVLPEPVTPSRTWWGSPRGRPWRSTSVDGLGLVAAGLNVVRIRVRNAGHHRFTTMSGRRCDRPVRISPRRNGRPRGLERDERRIG